MKTQSGGSYYAHFTAPSVALGKLNQFYVAYCRTVNGQHGCTCWSPSTTYTAPAAFPSTQPYPPSGTTQLVGDDFQRRYTTTAKKNALGFVGDGLGPDRVWKDAWDSGPTGNGSYVFKPAGGGPAYGVMPLDAVAVYKGAFAAKEHSYVEVDLTLDQTDNQYNFDVQGRRQEEPNTVVAYIAKLHRGLRGAPADAVRLTIYQWDLAAFGHDANELTHVEFGQDQGGCQTGSCSCAPPISGGDNATPTWIRLETADIGVDAVQVTATVFWGACGNTVDDCAYHCTVSVRDASPWAQLNMLGQTGGWSLDAHEKTYRILGFRAGSATPTP